RIIRLIEENPEIGIRGVKARSGLSYGTVQRTIRAEKLHAYHYTRVNALQPEDYPVRKEFCRRLLNMHDQDPEILNNILWTDECTFQRGGFWNSKNFHWYARENPHQIAERGHQRRFSINMWTGLYMAGPCLVGPFEFQENLNQNNYTDFLDRCLHPLCLRAGITQQQYDQMWFQQDGAPAHTSGGAQAWLWAHFPNRYIGRGGILDWPPRSPDLNPLDFFLWGYLKSKMYRHAIDDELMLQQRFQEALGTVTPE
ncbi:GSCOCG00012127001-RA-CDS, partial [Cotesia congregata]